ncbi:nucleolar protein 12-domain-containing protein [Thamnocephalis sphaerospora]|uniref:Nucleolar protein 12-domain-containing protein n=1 Tax=Thamnocephalis sphaerospora TaxID=78915 RepID=A0A4P9XWH0_9FUNG|nr:nucleolar protein 12-domain-containing protein [Thamnocephalis sphaerospora]|eukprot:RKP10664.1 nucleolar protein 12-domain-containing protein [Thamnocephalis sphaerospora]
MDNTRILTAGARTYAKKRKQRKEQVEEICFDDSVRREFLTGFQKRKQERRLAYKKRADEKARQERLEERKMRREAREEMAQQRIDEYEEYAKRLRRERGESSSEEEEEEEEEENKEKKKEETNTAEGDPWAVDSVGTGHVSSFKGGSTATTVTVISEMDDEAEVDAAARESVKARAKAAEQRKKTSEETIVQQEMEKLERSLSKQNKPKKFRYETKAARRATIAKSKSAKAKYHKKSK